jgi:uncharacterized protein (DUF1501 family)
MDRRNFIKLAACGVAAAMLPAAVYAAPAQRRQLICIHLFGGNDGLNTVAPVGDARYRSARPSLALRPDEVFGTRSGFGLHRALEPLRPLWERGRLAAVQGVGYPQPNRSHFFSTAIWQTAILSGVSDTGWLGRLIDRYEREAVNVGETLSVALAAERHTPLCVRAKDVFKLDDASPAVSQALNRLYGAAAVPPHLGRTYGRLQTAMQTLAKNRAANDQDDFIAAIDTLLPLLGQADVYHTSLESFDTHTGQRDRQATMLGRLAHGVERLWRGIETAGMADRTLVMIYSEFGRRVAENASGGTDHGTAGPVLLLGQHVRGGLQGEAPSLSDLDDGDLRHHLDFRGLYATVLEDWLGVDAAPVLGRKFDKIRILT